VSHKDKIICVNNITANTTVNIIAGIKISAPYVTPTIIPISAANNAASIAITILLQQVIFFVFF
jgi:hypothetical protein